MIDVAHLFQDITIWWGLQIVYPYTRCPSLLQAAHWLDVHRESFSYCSVTSYLGLPWWLSGKESACNAGDTVWSLGQEDSPRRRKWQPTPVFLPGKKKSHEQSLVGYSPRPSNWTCTHSVLFRFDLSEPKEGVWQPSCSLSVVSWTSLPSPSPKFRLSPFLSCLDISSCL